MNRTEWNINGISFRQEDKSALYYVNISVTGLLLIKVYIYAYENKLKLISMFSI